MMAKVQITYTYFENHGLRPHVSVRRHSANYCCSFLQLFVLLYLVSVSIIGCDEGVYELTESQREHFINNETVAPFLAVRADIYNFYHYMDTGYFSFSFSANNESPTDIFRKTDGEAKEEGWRILEEKDSQRIYIKKSTAYPAVSHFDKVTLIYGKEKSEVSYVHERAYS